MELRVAFSKASGEPKYRNYVEWLYRVIPEMVAVDISAVQDPVEALQECAGLVLTGGPDIAPYRYGRPEYAPLCTETPDEERDELELRAIQQAVELKMPILAICRGAQVLNVAFGGTLIADLPTQRQTPVTHWKVEGKDSIHDVTVLPATLLWKYTHVEQSEVASAHHQAVEELAPVFMPSALAPDGVVEAFEWANPEDRGFLIAVQWHPERMPWENPLSSALAERFALEVESYARLFRC
ncbi:MAG: gamma-glutamyl-gamma-aminobutyrate hydrolase family protein [Candidatus Kapabacteria bacterium]|nr:gamma-glutamyl-gamma-aminobutyrate hydrolase family protein [Candidatus Kapabacteria bacterium]MDW8012348.1 gamma-glutamyl-gamma-aminobutyrate hydrolase family protein [Bacteroidota bacterium]